MDLPKYHYYYKHFEYLSVISVVIQILAANFQIFHLSTIISEYLTFFIKILTTTQLFDSFYIEKFFRMLKLIKGN